MTFYFGLGAITVMGLVTMLLLKFAVMAQEDEARNANRRRCTPPKDVPLSVEPVESQRVAGPRVSFDAATLLWLSRVTAEPVVQWSAEDMVRMQEVLLAGGAHPTSRFFTRTLLDRLEHVTEEVEPWATRVDTHPELQDALPLAEDEVTEREHARFS